jgi:hypothetical protein
MPLRDIARIYGPDRDLKALAMPIMLNCLAYCCILTEKFPAGESSMGS